MGYATTDNVQAQYMGIDFSVTGAKITAAEVQSMIDDYSALIDARIGTLYHLPITNTSDLRLLKLVCIKLVVCDIDGIIREKLPDKKLARKRDVCTEASDLLHDLTSGKLNLNSTKIQGSVSGQFGTTDSNGDTTEPFFKRSNADPTTWC